MILTVCLFGLLLCCNFKAHPLENWQEYVEYAEIDEFYSEQELFYETPIYEPIYRESYHEDQYPHNYKDFEETIFEGEEIVREEKLLSEVEIARERLLLDSLNLELEEEWGEFGRRGRASDRQRPVLIQDDVTIVPVKGKVIIATNFNGCRWNIPPPTPLLPTPTCAVMDYSDANLPISTVLPVSGKVTVAGHFANCGPVSPVMCHKLPVASGYCGEMLPVRAELPVIGKVTVGAHFDCCGSM